METASGSATRATRRPLRGKVGAWALALALCLVSGCGRKTQACAACGGTRNTTLTCARCDGSGRRLGAGMCSACNGTGTVVGRCPHCRGQGSVALER